MLKKLIPAAAFAVLFAGSAQAQFGAANGNTGLGNGGFGMNMLSGDTKRTPEEAERDRQIEAEYNRTVNEKIPDKKKPADPWGNVRSAPANSSASKQPR